MSQFTPHSIKVPNGIQVARIQAMCEFKETIYLGYEGGHLLELVYNPESSAEPYREPQSDPISLFQSDKPKFMGMYSVRKPAIMFCHMSLNDRPGPVVVFTREMNRDELCTVQERCTLFSMSNEQEEPTIVLAVEKKFFVYRLNASTESSKGTDYLTEVAMKVDCGAQIQAIGVNKNAVCFYAGGKYRSYWLDKGSFVEISSSFMPDPFVLPVSDENFLIGNVGTMIVTGRIGEKTSNSIAYNKGFTKQVKGDRPTFLLWFKDYTFEFFPEMCLMAQISHKQIPAAFRDIPVPRVKLATRRFELDDLLLLNDEEMVTIGGVSHGTRLASMALASGGIDVVAIQIQRIKNVKDQQDVLVDMFKDLWVREPRGKDAKDKYAKAKLYAVQLLSKVLWKGDIREVLSLFPFILMANPLEQRVVLNQTQPVEHPDKELLDAFGQFLLFTDNEYKISNDNDLMAQVPILDTALFEFYAAFHQTRYLDAFMKEQNSIDFQLVGTFFTRNLKPMKLHPALAVYYTNKDKIPDALNIWKALDQADKNGSAKWALEASYTLQLVRQKKVLDDNLAWIKARSVNAAVNALLYPTVDVFYAQEWIEENCPTYMLKFYDFIMQQTGQNAPKLRTVEDGLEAFCKVLKDMDSPDFNVNVLTYNDKAVAASPGRHPEMIDDLANEAANKVARIVRQFGAMPGMDLRPFVDIIAQTKHRWLLFEFYAVGEMYQQAIDLVFRGTPDFRELENFCRNAPNPKKAFSVAFNQMKADGRDILSGNADFLIRNLEWLDFAEMLDWLPEDELLANVDNILQTASAILIEKERIAHMKLDIAQSMKLDVDYRLVKAHLRNVEIQHNTVCQGCHRPVGNGWVAVAPDSRVYHITCKPKLAPR